MANKYKLPNRLTCKWKGIVNRCSLTLAATAFLSCVAVAQEITVAAAADLQFAFQDVAARFQKETGKNVKLIFCRYRVPEETRSRRAGRTWNFVSLRHGEDRVVDNQRFEARPETGPPGFA